jgi:hypothetical protein
MKGCGIGLEKMPDKQRNIFAAFTQRREANGKGIEAIKEVFAKEPLANGDGQWSWR